MGEREKCGGCARPRESLGDRVVLAFMKVIRDLWEREGGREGERRKARPKQERYVDRNDVTKVSSMPYA
ncbi:hypothetical protein CEP53_001942 [Fusarium sp. AF-6]|nr:hypothetical protein CEP53_001942 [Fusarium sp. AF-6]